MFFMGLKNCDATTSVFSLMKYLVPPKLCMFTKEESMYGITISGASHLGFLGSRGMAAPFGPL
jgi:hypothetical protein